MVTNPRTIRIDPLSCVSLSLECYRQGRQLGSGTGFVVSHDDRNFLVTNWHIVTLRNPGNGRPLLENGLADPDEIRIWYHATERLGSWVRVSEYLLDPKLGTPRWREHPRKKEIDVVALPTATRVDARIYPLDTSLSNTDLIVSPSEPVSIVGFPFGRAAAGKFPIWKTGHVASDLDLDYDEKPVFLIDATGRPGMSGSPVIARRQGMYLTSSGWHFGGGDSVRFLGIFSGSIQLESEIGMVWKPQVIAEILA